MKKLLTPWTCFKLILILLFGTFITSCIQDEIEPNQENLKDMVIEKFNGEVVNGIVMLSNENYLKTIDYFDDSKSKYDEIEIQRTEMCTFDCVETPYAIYCGWVGDCGGGGSLGDGGDNPPDSGDPDGWDGGDSGSGEGGPGGGSSGGSSSGDSGNNDADSDWPENTILFANVSDPKITNVTTYLKCFNLSQGAKLTLYVDQPKANKSDTWSVNPNPFDPIDVGHTFISITQNGITRTLGYYPTSGTIDPSEGVISSPSVIRNNEGHAYDVSISVSINGLQLSSIISNMANYNSTYNLNTYNCTDFGVSIANAVGMGVKDTSGTWPYGGNGSNPGNLGQDIRNMALPSGATRNTSGGTAVSNKGTCN